ncbi:MAG: 4Fe-4S binding protein [Desulfobacterales bacterium]|nr:4Fe-4S binding protein [Desulfobacterales bacterium]
MAKIAMMIDTSKCIGCKACQIACQQWHSKPAEDTSFTGSYQNPEDLSGASLNVVKFIEVGNNGDLRWLFFPDRCRQCVDPYCKDACPLGAIKQHRMGFSGVNEARCDPSKCQMECQTACPFKTGSPTPMGIPRVGYMKDGELQDTKAQKCDFCYDRIFNPTLRGADDSAGIPNFDGEFVNSRRPACELSCPTGAIRAGYAEQIISWAKARIRYLKNNGYPNATGYPGLYTHVVWVLTEDRSVYGL